MNIRRILAVFPALCLAVGLMAQQPAEVINQSLQRLKTGTCKASFSLTQREKRGAQDVSLSGTIVMGGARFFVDAGVMRAWYDGTTQWVWLAEQNEVSITEPTEEEAADMNPMMLVRSYLDKCRVIFSATEKSPTHYVIEFYPKDKLSELLCLTLRVRKADKMPVSIVIKTSKGGYTNLQLTNLQSAAKAPDATFVFNRKEYPKAYINDLR